MKYYIETEIKGEKETDGNVQELLYAIQQQNLRIYVIEESEGKN